MGQVRAKDQLELERFNIGVTRAPMMRHVHIPVLWLMVADLTTVQEFEVPPNQSTWVKLRSRKPDSKSSRGKCWLLQALSTCDLMMSHVCSTVVPLFSSWVSYQQCPQT